jgi:uncharacterized protein YggL (DUF469 family)
VRKRLRKKRHLGEFQELGFELTFRILGSDDAEQETDRLFEFLEGAIEANGMYFGGVGTNGRWSGVVHCPDRPGTPTTDARREMVIAWLRARTDFEFFEASVLFDVWYGELPSESEKPKPNWLISADRNPCERGSRPMNSYR